VHGYRSWMSTRPSRHTRDYINRLLKLLFDILIFYSAFLHLENKVMPIVESDRMLSNGEQHRIMCLEDQGCGKLKLIVQCASE
jgi:hypothetical protein